MNDQSDERQSPVSEPAAQPAQPNVRNPGRRRLVKLGAGVAPVALTLTSRPVRAWHCNTASAWGSAQISSNASTAARNTTNQLADESWTISNWRYNTTRAGLPYPWVRLGTQSSTGACTNNSKNYSIADLFGASGPFPKSLTGTDKVWDKICNGTEFQKYMIVAKLNSKFIANIKECLESNDVDQLKGMLGGTFRPANTGSVIWYEPEIIAYLYNNWIVRPS